MKVRTSVQGGMTENEEGIPVDTVSVHCSRCHHYTESFGTSEASIKRCLVMLREECPYGEQNWYLSPD